jgi:ubiquinone/menaquinone biosynthesis C-methylase UbiE
MPEREKSAKRTRIRKSRIVYLIITLILDNPLRRFTINPVNVLTKMGLQRGQNVLEVGCGPGYFTIAAARIVEDGNLYPLDISPFMIERVRKKARKHRMENVKTIIAPASDTGLDDESLDMILCIDVLSDIDDIDRTLVEMFRILKPDGTLSVFEPHAKFEPGAWKPDKSIKELTGTGLFSLQERNNEILKFKKVVGHSGQQN